MKRSILAAICIALSLECTAWSQTQTASADANSSATMSVPLNQYGAVDVNAKVPLAIQVPEVSPDFQAPSVTSLAENFPELVPPQPQLNVQAYLLMDANNGQILAEYNGNKRLPPASIAKLMLVYVASQQLAQGNIHLSDIVQIPEVAWATGGSRMFLKPGDRVTVQQLINGILVDSGNDAAVALAIHIAGNQDAFVSLMNQTASSLGMTNTHFSDVMGLPAPNLYSSARDLAVLGRSTVTDYPDNLAWFGQKSFTYNNIKQYNFNKLLFIYPYADGLKTGSTQDAGFSLVSTAKTPDSSMRLIGVVLGATTNDQNASDSKALLTYGFRFFDEQLLYPASTTLAHTALQKGATKQVAVGVLNPLYITWPKNRKGTLNAHLEITPNLTAPMHKGDAVGTLVVTLNGKPLLTSPVFAMEDVSVGNIWQRFWNWLT